MSKVHRLKPSAKDLQNLIAFARGEYVTEAVKRRLGDLGWLNYTRHSSYMTDEGREQVRRTVAR